MPSPRGETEGGVRSYHASTVGEIELGPSCPSSPLSTSVPCLFVTVALVLVVKCCCSYVHGC